MGPRGGLDVLKKRKLVASAGNGTPDYPVRSRCIPTTMSRLPTVNIQIKRESKNQAMYVRTACVSEY